MTDAGELHTIQSTFGKSPYELLIDASISDGAARQYGYMHWRYGKNKRNFEGRESIAEALRTSERTVTNRAHELEQADWIVVIREYNKEVRQTRNFYHVFEDRAECCQWRIKHGIEKPKPKPNSGRKLRANKGGKPTHKPKDGTELNSGSDRNVNLSSVQVLNSSSAYPDSDYPDSIYPDKDQNLLPAAAPEKTVSDYQRMFGAVCWAVGIDPQYVTDDRKSAIGKTAKSIMAAKGKPEQMAGLMDWLKKKALADDWSSPPTENAMRKYWPDYATYLDKMEHPEVIDLDTPEAVAYRQRAAMGWAGQTPETIAMLERIMDEAEAADGAH